LTNIVKYKGNKDVAIDLTEATVTGVMALTDGVSATVGALTNDTIGTTPEDAFITITIDGTAYKIPAWLDNA